MKVNIPSHLGLLVPLLVLPAAAQLELVWNLPIPASSVSGAALGDLDGDGDRDLFLSNFSASGVLLLNDGSGMFSLLSVQPEFASGGQGAWGDLDGDGDLDLVTADYFDPCSVYFNDGFGAFTDSGQSVGQSAIRGEVHLVDLDSDSDLDLVLPSDDSSKPNEIWINDGSGTFTDSGQNLGNFFTICAAVGDLDGDSDPDLIMGNNGFNTVWINDGAGTFTPGTSLPLTGTTFGIGLADLDGDSDLDAFVANGSIGGQANQVHLNDGSGVFTNLAQPSFSSDYHTAVALDDLDGDGDIDALVSRNRGQLNQIWLNDGSGLFSLSGTAAGPGGSFRIGAGDIDGDTDTDFILPTDTTPPRALLRGPGATLVETAPFAGSAANDALAADFNNDGDLDVVLGNIAGSITFLVNDGSGDFSDPGTVLPNPPGNNIETIEIGDLDGVNGPDLAVFCSTYSGNSDGRDRIWLNNGGGGFTESPQILDSAGGGTLKIGDIDGDTDLDIVTVNMESFGFDGQNSVFVNNGSGTFTRSDALGIGSQRTLALIDLDTDGDLDAFVGGAGIADTVWLNNGTGGFTDSGQSLGTGSPFALAVADFDGDTDTDVFCVNAVGGNRLWLNDGSGTFTDSGVAIGPSFASTARPYDYDDDGDLDLWIGYGGISAAPDRIMVNDGTGSFSFGPSDYGNVATSAVVIGDFTGDGSDDAFIASAKSNHQLWAADVSPVSLWAGTFGLLGDDQLPHSDPDGDNIPNFLEMAYNLNPDLADANPLPPGGTSGLPRLEYNPTLGQFEIIAIRRRNAPFLTYTAQMSPNLVVFSPPASPGFSTTNFSPDYQRVTITFPTLPGLSRNFARLMVDYTP